MEAQEYTVEYIIANADYIDWLQVCYYTSLEVIAEVEKDFKDELDWWILSHRELTEEFRNQFEEQLAPHI